jgi:SP family sugar:H+ symporter-like MFS transporter
MPGSSLLKHFNKQLILACSLVALSTFNYGFDNQAFATTQAMTPFTEQFGVYNSPTNAYVLEPYWLSLFNSMNYIGFGAGAYAHSPVKKLY